MAAREEGGGDCLACRLGHEALTMGPATVPPKQAAGRPCGPSLLFPEAPVSDRKEAAPAFGSS